MPFENNKRNNEIVVKNCKVTSAVGNYYNLYFLSFLIGK